MSPHRIQDPLSEVGGVLAGRYGKKYYFPTDNHMQHSLAS